MVGTLNVASLRITRNLLFGNCLRIHHNYPCNKKGQVMFEFVMAVVIAISPATITVNGMDGIVEMRDAYGNVMIVEADCARVITDSGIDNLQDVHRNGVTATPEYIKACF